MLMPALVSALYNPGDGPFSPVTGLVKKCHVTPLTTFVLSSSVSLET